MSMSTHVIGFTPPDEKWRKMKAIWDACKKANIEPPKKVEYFFNYKDPDEKGVEVEISFDEWSDDCKEGVEISLDKIPKHVKVIRFYNAY